MQSSKWFEKLKDMGVEIHIRSILQDYSWLLEIEFHLLSKWKTHFDYWNNWVETGLSSRSMYKFCLFYSGKTKLLWVSKVLSNLKRSHLVFHKQVD